MLKIVSSWCDDVFSFLLYIVPFLKWNEFINFHLMPSFFFVKMFKNLFLSAEIDIFYSEVKWKSLRRVWLFVTPWTIQSVEFSRPEYWRLSLLQRLFPTQGLNPGLLHHRQILYQLSHRGSSRTLEWVAYPFSSGSFRPGNWTGSPALQADSLPTELSGKSIIYNRPSL